MIDLKTFMKDAAAAATADFAAQKERQRLDDLRYVTEQREHTKKLGQETVALRKYAGPLVEGLALLEGFNFDRQACVKRDRVEGSLRISLPGVTWTDHYDGPVHRTGSIVVRQDEIRLGLPLNGEEDYRLEGPDAPVRALQAVRKCVARRRLQASASQP